MYRYIVENEKGNELLELSSMKPTKVISELTELLYMKFINKYQYTLRVKKGIHEIRLSFKEKQSGYTYHIIVPTRKGSFDAFQFQVDMKNEK